MSNPSPKSIAEHHDRMAAAGAVVSAFARFHECEPLDVGPDASDDEIDAAADRRDDDRMADAYEATQRLLKLTYGTDMAVGVAVEFALDLTRYALFALAEEVLGPDGLAEGEHHHHVGEWMHRLVVLELDTWESHRRALAGDHDYDRDGRPVGGFNWCHLHRDWHRLADGCPDDDGPVK